MIITRVKSTLPYSYLNVFPSQFKTDEEKQDPAWVKETVDYMANTAFSQYIKHKSGPVVRNYNLMKGIIDYEDFYEKAPEISSFVETLMQDTKLPTHIKHYPILNPPVNTMIGEQSKRPDNHRVRAFDDNSQSEEFEYKTDVVQKYIMQEAQQKIMQKLVEQGQNVQDMSEEDINNLTIERVKEYLTDYTSLAEMWSNHMLVALKARFNMKKKSEEAFRDLLIASREFFHIYEDNSALGFNIEVVNGKNQWHLGTPDNEYTSGVSGDSNVPYACGIVQVMEISEIIEKCQELTLEEIDHLQKNLQDYGLITGRPSSFENGLSGPESIQYDTYDRLIAQERMILEAEMSGDNVNADNLSAFTGIPSVQSAFGYKYTVVTAYFNSKKKIGNLTYLDEDGTKQNTLVDESYIEGSPNEIAIEWGWVNQWYKSRRIGPDIYHISPFKLFDYCPIIGLIHEAKNTTPTSLVDMMKPLQVMFNVVMNQLWELLGKEIGNVGVINVRRVPRPKDGDQQDVIDAFIEEGKQRGIIFDDDSPENTKGPTQNQTVARPLDLTRTNEIQSRLNLAINLKEMCWEMVGMNRQRLGGALATETATANQNALVQSFAQTEPYFAAHDYLLNQVYQALIDAAQWVESQKPESTINYLTNQGEAAFIKVTSSDIKNKDLWVLPTSRPEDNQLFQKMQELAQAAIQNGASIYDVSILFTSNSVRQMQKTFKELKEKQEEMQASQQKLEQQKVEQQQQALQQEAQQVEAERQATEDLKRYEIDTNARTKITVAEIAVSNRQTNLDLNDDGVPDYMDIAEHGLAVQNAIADGNIQNQKLAIEQQKLMVAQQQNKRQDATEREKLKVERERIQADKQISKSKSRPSK